MAFWRRKAKPKGYVIDERAPSAASPAVAARAMTRTRIASQSRRRIAMCAVVFCLGFAALGVRLAYVAFGGADIGRKIFTADAQQDGRRPEITDRTGALIATNLPMVTLEVAGSEVWDPVETAQALAGVMPDLDGAALAQKLAAGRYVEVAADLTPDQKRAVFRLGLPGVRFQSRYKRYYPQGALGAHVVGHTERGRGGVMGLEAALERTGGADEAAWSNRGAPVAASLDMRVQRIVEATLADAIAEFSARAGWALVMDVATGEIIALSSLPDFDPNSPGAFPADARRNRATYDRYELGSMFKALTAASALDAGVAEERTMFDARGVYKIADRTISDFHGENRVLTLSEVVQYSSNIGAAQLAALLGVDRQRAGLDRLGLFDPVAIELLENRPPQLPLKWGPVEAATVSYGHGISVTPLHMIAAYAAVVNGGQYVTPTFFKTAAPRSAQAAFSPATSIAMRRILRRVVTDGTASKAEAPGYFPIGKTATADKPVAGAYAKNARISSFVGAFPGHAPRYAVLVSLDEPQPTKATFGYATAGWNAAPAFATIVTQIAPVLGVMPVDETEALAGFFPEFQKQAALAPALESRAEASADGAGSP